MQPCLRLTPGLLVCAPARACMCVPAGVRACGCECARVSVCVCVRARACVCVLGVLTTLRTIAHVRHPSHCQLSNVF
jgi:hypothetical protein